MQGRVSELDVVGLEGAGLEGCRVGVAELDVVGLEGAELEGAG